MKLEAFNTRMKGLEEKASIFEEKLSTQEMEVQRISDVQRETADDILSLSRGQMRLEKRMEAAENALRECNIRVLGVPAGAEGDDPASFMASFLCKLLEVDSESSVFLW